MIIKDVYVSEDTLTIEMEDGTRIELMDVAQSCCEQRYMTCDDDLAYYVGAEYHDWELRDVHDSDDSYHCHEIQFLVVNTSVGDFRVANHNVHNGYYGGFSIKEIRS